MSKLLTIHDLSERWSLLPSQVEHLVRQHGIPYVPLRRGEKRVSFEHMRFRECDVEAWEASKVEIHASSKVTGQRVPPPAPPRILKHLGDYT